MCFYFIRSNPIKAIKLQNIFLFKSSFSCKNIAHKIKISTILKVVIEETRLRFQTTKTKTTQERDCKYLKTPVIKISFFVYWLFSQLNNVAIHKNKHVDHQLSIVPAVNPVIFCKALSASKEYS